MKKIVLFLFLIATFSMGYSQKCFSPKYLAQNKTWEITSYNAKGKTVGKTEYRVTEHTQKGGNLILTINSKNTDKKNKTSDGVEMKLICENGVFNLDMSSFIMASTFESMSNYELEIEAEQINFPSSVNSKIALKDGSVSVKGTIENMDMSWVPGMELKMTVKDRKIEGVETITTEAGTFECVKISQTLQLEDKYAKKEHPNIVWFLPEFGIIKNEIYMPNGKLKEYYEITAIGN